MTRKEALVREWMADETSRKRLLPWLSCAAALAYGLAAFGVVSVVTGVIGCLAFGCAASLALTYVEDAEALRTYYNERAGKPTFMSDDQASQVFGLAAGSLITFVLGASPGLMSTFTHEVTWPMWLMQLIALVGGLALSVSNLVHYVRQGRQMALKKQHDETTGISEVY
jgi:hypothetical protein